MRKRWLFLPITLSLVGLVIVLCVVLPKISTVNHSEDLAANQDPVRQGKQLLLGSWKGLWVEFEGNKVAPKKEQEFIYVFQDDKLYLKVGGHESEETYDIDPSRIPKTIDMSITAFASSTSEGKTKTWTEKEKVQGIYKLDGDRLIISVGPPKGGRPTEFVTKPGAPVMIFVFERLSE